MRGVISRAVYCKYRGGGHCNKRTKDASEMCHNHRRDNFQHKTSPDSAPNLRLREATIRIQSGDEAALRGKVVLNAMPTVHRNQEQVGVRNGTTPKDVDTLMWNDTQFTLQQTVPALYSASGISYPIVRSGTWIYAKFPDGSPSSVHDLMSSQAYATRNQAAYRLFKAQGMFDGLAERYDDKAEILVQLPLNNDPSLRINYSNIDGNELKVRISSVNGAGEQQTETYTVSMKRYSLAQSDMFVPNNEMDMPGTLTVDGQSYPVPEALSNTRAQFFHNLTEALNTIDSYSLQGDDGALYLPVGWMER